MSFPPTRLSVVARTRSRDEETRRLAFAAIIEAYWKPVYKYLRLKWQLDPDQAADLTQEFFAATLEKDRPWPLRSRTRALPHLPASLCGWIRVECEESRATTQARRRHDARFARLRDAEGEIGRHEPSVPADVDELFYQEWVRALFQRAVDDLRAWAQGSGRDTMFAVFERYDLAESPEDRPTYAALARDLGITPTTVTNHLAAMRRQFRRVVLDRLRDLTTTDEEFEAEARRLLGSAP
jgi:hypothetical protein